MPNLRARRTSCSRRWPTKNPSRSEAGRRSIACVPRTPSCPRACRTPRRRTRNQPMTPSLRRKLEALAERREELERLLADPSVIGDAGRFRTFSREFSQLEPVAVALAAEAAAKRDLAAAEAMRNDPELRELAEE